MAWKQVCNKCSSSINSIHILMHFGAPKSTWSTKGMPRSRRSFQKCVRIFMGTTWHHNDLGMVPLHLQNLPTYGGCPNCLDEDSLPPLRPLNLWNNSQNVLGSSWDPLASFLVPFHSFLRPRKGGAWFPLKASSF